MIKEPPQNGEQIHQQKIGIIHPKSSADNFKYLPSIYCGNPSIFENKIRNSLRLVSHQLKYLSQLQ